MPITSECCDPRNCFPGYSGLELRFPHKWVVFSSSLRTHSSSKSWQVGDLAEFPPDNPCSNTLGSDIVPIRSLTWRPWHPGKWKGKRENVFHSDWSSNLTGELNYWRPPAPNQPAYDQEKEAVIKCNDTLVKLGDWAAAVTGVVKQMLKEVRTDLWQRRPTDSHISVSSWVQARGVKTIKCRIKCASKWLSTIAFKLL